MSAAQSTGKPTKRLRERKREKVRESKRRRERVRERERETKKRERMRVILDFQVAVKIVDLGKLCNLFRSFAGADVIDEIIKREIEVMKRLSHPNIVAYVDSCWVDGRAHLFMEMVEGKTLLRCIPPGGMREGEAMTTFYQLCSAVAYCHSHQVLLLSLFLSFFLFFYLFLFLFLKG